MTAGSDETLMLMVKDVAHLRNVHVSTVRRWSNKGILKVYRICPRADRRFQEEDIADFLLQEGKESQCQLRKTLL
jgi:predicted site-specific integrase-resolvase